MGHLKGVLGFPYAVVKKYGGDAGGRQAALITYYGFLSILLLLLLGVAVLSRVLADHPDLRQRLVAAIVPQVLRSTVEHSLATLPASTVPFVASLIGRNHPGKGDAASAELEKAARVTVRDPRLGSAPMMPATSNPAKSAGAHYMEGCGCGLIVFASVLLSSRGGPGVVVGHEWDTVTIAKAAKVIPVRGFRAGHGGRGDLRAAGRGRRGGRRGGVAVVPDRRGRRGTAGVLVREGGRPVPIGRRATGVCGEIDRQRPLHRDHRVADLNGQRHRDGDGGGLVRELRHLDVRRGERRLEPASIATLAGILLLSVAPDYGWKHFRDTRMKNVQLARQASRCGAGEPQYFRLLSRELR